MKRCPLCAVVVGELAEKCPHCNGRLLPMKPPPEPARMRVSPWLLLIVVGSAVLAWALWQAAMRG